MSCLAKPSLRQINYLIIKQITYVGCIQRVPPQTNGSCVNLREALENQVHPQDNGVVMQARIGLMGGKQLGLYNYEITVKKQAKRRKFLSEMELVVPQRAMIVMIEPHYPEISKKGGRPP